jgi:hypothetical protein
MDAQDAQKDTLSNSSESFALQLEEITEEDELCELIDKIMEASPNTLTKENIKPFDLPLSPPETNKLESLKNAPSSKEEKLDTIGTTSHKLPSPLNKKDNTFFSEKTENPPIFNSLPSSFEKLDIEEPPPPPKNIFYQTGEFLWNSLTYTWTLSTGWIPQISFLKKKEA